MQYPEMFFLLGCLIRRVTSLIVIIGLLRLERFLCVESRDQRAEIRNGTRFDYIIVGASANGLIVVRSLLEKYTRRGEEISILIVDKGSEYVGGSESREERCSSKEGVSFERMKDGGLSYTPVIDRASINLLTSEDGYLIFDSNVEGGETSYGSTPFVPEDVYTGEYYRSLGLNFDMQRLQESFEYVKSVGDIMQPNVRTSWIIALERAFNETGTFYVEDESEKDLVPEDSLFENEMTESGYLSSLQVGEASIGEEESYPGEIKSSGQKDVSDGGILEHFTSAHYVPYTFLTYGFRRGLERRSGARLLQINPRISGGKQIFKILNFHVEKIIFSSLGSGFGEEGKFAECIQGRRWLDVDHIHAQEGDIGTQSEAEVYCVKPRVGRVILSAGALNTPIILQRSGVGSVEDIKISNPELERPIIENDYVGKGLRDHPSLSLFGFFRGASVDFAHTPSSNALFSKRRFGSTCKRLKDRDDVMHGCENISISEFEGFTDSIHEFLGDRNLISSECMSLIRGVTIRIPNPHSEGEIIWDYKGKKPRVKLGLLEDVNDLLILEAGFRRLIRLFRSANISSLLVPNISGQRITTRVSNSFERRVPLNSTASEVKSDNITSNRQHQGVPAIYERCNLESLMLRYSSHDYKVVQDEAVSGRFYYGEERLDDERAVHVRKGLEVLDRRGGLSISPDSNRVSGLSYLKELHDKLKIQAGVQSIQYGKMYKLDGFRGEDAGEGVAGRSDSSGVMSKTVDSRYGIKGESSTVFERDERLRMDEPSLWRSLPFILPRPPSYPEQIREYIKRNVKSGNEFVGTTAIGHVVETDCFRMIGTENLYILDEGILSRHTSSSPIGTSMILSRYAITKIMHDKC
ncbi:hypothetical protein OIY81_552 [Cryptosporidium canis]|uniref:Glucose-methanol-choline oxidoreductase N-terminal domain-containing protein n=1 Tax=Cryptosporidium canis TaxID=195482 RepID=A0ABQ8P9C6_9CRYT|nr:hypothetical protein OJ252_1235 [Cryptosporidium canis]KAJ1614211.1 hypothetical protein OIY81_552 [Cryptosporidium canis]